MKKILLCSSGILLLIFISANAQAYLVQQLPGSIPMSYSSNANTYYGLSRVADDFTLSSASTITGITWWGFNESGGWSGTSSYQGFTFTFYADNSGIPGASLLTIDPVTLTSANVDNYYSPSYAPESVWVYTAALSVPLNAGTYWLSIYDTNTSSKWGWMMSDDAPDGVTPWALQKIGAGEWTPTYDLSGNSMYSNAAFKLTGSQVPIPTAAWLLALGLIGLAVVRRRIRR